MVTEKQRLEKYKNVNPNELTLKQFKKIEEEMKKTGRKTISDEYFDFKLWCSGLPSRQENFAEYVDKILLKKNAKNILEVGSGRTCRLSRILEAKGYNMTCIDPNIEKGAIGKSNIIIKKAFFHQKCDISKYDYIIAQEPCDATEHIIRACVEQEKPFIITLCAVPHNLISGEKLENVWEWYQYLLRISTQNDIRLRFVYLDPLLETAIMSKD